jgi:hypothetical protein
MLETWTGDRKLKVTEERKGLKEPTYYFENHVH